MAFSPPDFLQDQDALSILQRMMSHLPPDLEQMEAGFTWDLLMPVALEQAETLQYKFIQVLQIMFPQYAYGSWLDLHGQTRGMVRKAATAARVQLQIQGQPGLVLPQGFVCSTKAAGDQPGQGFFLLAPALVPETGVIMAEAQALNPGKIGNVPAQTIGVMATPLAGVTNIINPQPATGGTEEETDESFRLRIAENDTSRDISFVNSMADFRRWALEVPGVGAAVIIPATDDTGLVTIVLTDANGEPAHEALCQAVYQHIMRPDDPLAALAQINTLLSVIPPDPVPLTVTASVTLVDGGDLDTVTENFRAQLQQYFVKACEEGEIKYSMVGSLLANTLGIYDYTQLFLNQGTDNVPLSQRQYPGLEKVALQES